MNRPTVWIIATVVVVAVAVAVLNVLVDLEPTG